MSFIVSPWTILFGILAALVAFFNGALGTVLKGLLP